MKLEDITEQNIREVDDQELLSLHHRLHQLFGANFEDDQDQAGSLTPELLSDIHEVLTQEMLRRGINHDTPMGGDEDMYDADYFKGMIKPDLVDYGDIIAIARNIKGRMVLDVGCGPGKVAHTLIKSGYDVTGLDSHPTAVHMAKSAGVRAELSDAASMPFPNDTFDTVFTNHVLEHIVDFKKVMSECLRVAKERVIHIVPIGRCLDVTHVHTFKSLDDIRQRIALPGVTRHVTPAGTFGQNACIIFYKTMSTGHPVLDALDDAMVIPDFACLVGSAVKAHDPGDVDILFRAPYVDPGMEMKIMRMLPQEMRESVHFVYHEAGPHGDNIPLFDLVLRKKPEFELVRTEKAALKPIQRFTPLKTASGYAAQEFFAEEEFWNNWAGPLINEGKQLDVEQKYNGLRAVSEMAGDEFLIYFEDSKTDRAKQLPAITSDLKSIGKDVILDGDLGGVYGNGKPVERKWLATLTTANQKVDEDGLFKTGEGLDASLVYHVFDVLYYDGRDLHTLPWLERRKVLEDIFSKHDFKTMKMGPVKIVSGKTPLLSEVTRVSKIPGSEGAVIKVVDSDYPLTGQTPSWAKVKNHVEVKVVILDKVPIKGGGWGYVVGYTGEDGKVAELGKTFNTKIGAKVGDYLTLIVEEVVPRYNDAKKQWEIGTVVPKVQDVDVSGRKAPEDIKSIVIRADKGNVLQASPSIREAMAKDGYGVSKCLITVIKQTEGQLDFKEGDEGTGILQTHERGLTEDQVKLLGPNFHFGWDPVKLSDAQINRLGELSGGGDWNRALERAADGDSQGIVTLMKKIKREGLATSDRKLIALVEPVSVHTDFRLRPEGADFWEGGEGFTPGNQFKENKFRIIEPDPDFKILANFKVAREDQIVSAASHIIRGPLVWLAIGEGKPKSYPPGAVGSTSDAWSRFYILDKVKWKAGVQDKHFKEFWFDGDVLKGRWVFQFVPTGGGVRQWMISRPNKQEMASELFKARAWTVPIAKTDQEQRTVTGIVLEPETTDAHGDIYDEVVIAAAMQKFMEDYQKVGVMHRDFTRSDVLKIVECFIAPQPLLMGGQHVKKGSWVMTVKILDDGIWDAVKQGLLRAFSIGGTATVIPT